MKFDQVLTRSVPRQSLGEEDEEDDEETVDEQDDDEDAEFGKVRDEDMGTFIKEEPDAARKQVTTTTRTGRKRSETSDENCGEGAPLLSAAYNV